MRRVIDLGTSRDEGVSSSEIELSKMCSNIRFRLMLSSKALLSLIPKETNRKQRYNIPVERQEENNSLIYIYVRMLFTVYLNKYVEQMQVCG